MPAEAAGAMGRPSRRTALRYALAAFVAAAAVGALAVAWQVQSNRWAVDSHVDALASDVVAHVKARMQSYEYGLRGARGAVVATGPERMTREDFRRYALTRDIEQEFPGARGFGFIRRVPPADAADFVARARRDGAPDFSIRQLTPHGGEHYVIQYIEPEAGNVAAIGLDIASEPTRREAAVQAMRTGKATLTGPITLVQAQGKPRQSFLLLLPLYATPAVPGDVATREAAALGWSYAPLSADDVLTKMDSQTDQYRLTLRDIGSAATMGSSAPPFFATSEEAAPDSPVRRLPLEVFGRHWEAEVQPLPAFIAALRLRSPAETAAEAALGVVLITALAWFYGQAKARRQLRRAEQAERADMIELAADAFVGVDLDGRITSWNPAAASLFGYRADEAMGRQVDKLLVPPSRHQEVAPLMAHIHEGQPVAPYETTRLSRDGRELDVMVSMAPLRDADGQVVGMVKTLRDIGKAKNAQRRLEQLTADLELKVAERTAGLDAARRDLRNILDALPSMVGYWDRELHNRFANQAYRLSFGDRAGGLADQTLPELVGAERFERDRAHVEAALRGEVQTFELSTPGSDGTGERHALARYLPDLVDGEVRGFYLLVHDVTELKQSRQAAAAALRDNAFLLDTIHQHAIMSMTDSAGVIVDVNEAFCAISGYERDELLGHTHRMVNSGTQGQGFWPNIWRTITSGQAWRGEICNRAKDGSLYWVDSIIAPFVGTEGRIDRYISIRFDITERKRVAAELAQTTSLLRTVLASASEVAIIATDPDFTIRVFNQGAEKLLGYTAAEIVGTGTPALLHVPDEIRTRARELSQTLGRTVRGGDYFREPAAHGVALDWHYRRKDGSLVAVSLTVTAMRGDDEGLLGYLGIARDISAEKRHQQALLDAKRMAEQANKAKSQFLANMSHEIRTPMNAVIGLSYLLEQTPLNAHQSELLLKMARASKSLLGVINDVLDLSKIEAGELGISPQPFAPTELVEYLADVMRVQAASKGIELLLDLPANLPPLVIGDSLRVNQILTNLLGNAIKFTEIGQVKLTALALPAAEGFTRLRFEVRDTGIGISPDATARLFQPFAQADGSITRRFGGTGLGLSIVRQLAEMMGGEVGVSSEPGAGSCFWVELPLPIADPAAVAAPQEHAAPTDARTLRGVRVLVVDDSEINLEVAKRILESVGARVTLAADGQEAVDHLRAHGEACDVVLMDIHMPVMDGLTASRQIRDQLGLRQLPIVALSAGALASQRTEARFAGMNDFITKPFAPSEVIHCIARFVGRSDAVKAPALPRPAPSPVADWPAIAGIDGPAVAARLGGDLALFRTLLRYLLQEYPRLPRPEATDLGALAERMHKLRGSSGNVGAAQVHATAVLAEKACQQADLMSAIAQVDSLNRQLDELAAAARPWLDAVAEAPAAPGRSLESEDLDELMRLLRQQHVSAIDHFETLSQALLARLGEQRFNTLREHVEQLRFAEAAALLDGPL